MMTLGDNKDGNKGNSPVQKEVDQESWQREDRGRLSIGSWTAILASLELELQKLKSELQDYKKAKEQCKVELLKVELQVEDRIQLVQDAEEKFARLEFDIFVANTELVALHFDFPNC